MLHNVFAKLFKIKSLREWKVCAMSEQNFALTINVLTCYVFRQVSEVNILSVWKSLGIVNVNMLFMWMHFWCVSRKNKWRSITLLKTISIWKMCEIQSPLLSVTLSYYKMNKLNVKTTVNVWLLCGLIKAGCLDSLLKMKWAYINENRFLTSVICQWIEL